MIALHRGFSKVIASPRVVRGERAKTNRPTVDGKIKRFPRFRNFVPKCLSAHCFGSVSDLPLRCASGAFSDYHSVSMLREPSPAIGCKAEMAVSSPAQVFPRCITRTAFLVLRDDVRLPIVV